MTKSTTVKVSTSTRDALKEIADRDGISLDAAIRKLLRSERQRVMGAELAERSATDDDVAWVTGATAAVARAIR